MTSCGLVGIESKAAHSPPAHVVTEYLPSTIISNAALNMRSAGSPVRFRFDSRFDAGDYAFSVQADGAMDPGRSALTMKRRIKDRSNETATVRHTVVEDRVYAQFPGVQGWLRFTPQQASEAGLNPSSSDPLDIPELLDLVKNRAQKMGTETLNGVATTRYVGTIDEEDADALPDDASSLWTESGLTELSFTVHLSQKRFPVRVVINGSGSDTFDERELPFSVSVSVDYTGWGESVRVRAPKSSVSAKESGFLDLLRRENGEGESGDEDSFTV